MFKMFQATVLTSAGCLWVIDQNNKETKRKNTLNYMTIMDLVKC